MTDARILPDLQCSLICEDVRQEANGNIFLVGVLNQIVVPQVQVVIVILTEDWVVMVV